MDELHQPRIRGEHEGVDHYVGSFAARDFFERLAYDQWIETERVAVDASVIERQRRGLAVGNHYDLLHILGL